MEFQNVLETYPLYDTVLVQNDLASLSLRPQGWFASFAAMGNATDIPFFNQRNVASAGLPYCNLETRDQCPWPFLIRQLNIHFFAPQFAAQLELPGTHNLWEMKHTPIWEADLPRHFGVEVKVNTDIKLEAAVMMPGSGGGPVGGGYGSYGTEAGGPETSPLVYNSGSQGVAHRSNGFKFPIPIDVPKKAALSVTLYPSEYGRRLLQAMAGPFDYTFPNTAGTAMITPAAVFGIRVTLHGTRGVQQRGEAHA